MLFTSYFEISFLRGSGLELDAYADADYASKAAERRSVSGAAVMYAGACVCRCSSAQRRATLSTAEAEYVALADTIKDILFCGTCGAIFSWSWFCMHHCF